MPIDPQEGYTKHYLTSEQRQAILNALQSLQDRGETFGSRKRFEGILSRTIALVEQGESIIINMKF